jgi:arsenical pump membrane protein
MNAEVREFDAANPHVWIALVAFAFTILCTILSPQIPIPNIYVLIIQPLMRKIRRSDTQETEANKSKFVRFPLDMGTAPIFALGILFACTTLNWSTFVTGVLGNDYIRPYSVLILFMSLSYCCISLDLTGLFEFTARKLIVWSRGSGMALFFSFCIFASVLTVFTSNDIVILTLTPILCYAALQSENLDPIPFVLSQFFLANIWSISLVIGNPTNIIVAEAVKLNFVEYTKWLGLPAVAAGLTCQILLFLIFFKRIPKVVIQKQQQKQVEIDQGPLEEEPRRSSMDRLTAPVNHNDEEHEVNEVVKVAAQPKLREKPQAIIKTLLLFSCLLTLGISSIWGVPAYLITVIFLVLYLVMDFVQDGILLVRYYRTRVLKSHDRSVIWGVTKRMPWKIIPFALGMFIIVAVLKYHGVTGLLAKGISRYINWLGGVSSVDNFESLSFWERTRAIFASVFTMTYLSSIACNLLNNQPMTILFTDILQDAGWSGKALTPMYNGAQFGLIIGSNLGANITLIGALAGIMWINILRQFNDPKINQMSFFKFLGYGIVVMPLVIFMPSLVLSLEMMLF